MKSNASNLSLTHIEGATRIGEKFYLMATRAELDHLPPGETGDHHFFRPAGDFAEITGRENGFFLGRWVHSMTLSSSGNGIKRFPKEFTRPIRRGKEERALANSLFVSAETESFDTSDIS